MKVIEKEVNGIKIRIDYRMELLGIIMHISNYKEKYPFLFVEYKCNKFYYDLINKYFSKYKDDEVIKEFESIVKTHSFNYDAPINMFLQLDENFKTNKLNDYVFIDRLKSDNKIYDFINKLDDFALRINFKEFYEKNIDLYTKWVNSFSISLKMYDIRSFYNNYFGYINDKEFIINLMPCITNGGFACDLSNSLVCAYPVFEKMNNLFDNDNNHENALLMIIHEFSHGYINPITDKYNLLTDKTNLFDDIRYIMKRQAYPYDSLIINEHIVRSVVLRFISLIFDSSKLYNSELKYELKSGFKYINVVLDSLIYYENNRDKYKVFDEYYPVIIDNIKSYKESM